MTLVIALACKDGIVMASDCQSTMPSSGTPVRQITRKIKKVADSILWGGSGHVNFIQKIERGIDSLPRESRRSDIDNFIPAARGIIINIRREILEAMRLIHGANADNIASKAVTIFAGLSNGKPKIIAIDHDGNDIELQDYGYAAIGIGDTFAHTILKNFDNINELSLEYGKLVAYKVVKDAIDVGAYGLGEPIDIWTLREVVDGEKKKIVTENISEEELSGISDTYNTLIEAQNTLFKTICNGKLQQQKDSHKTTK